jgi:hypothetical protein
MIQRRGSGGHIVAALQLVMAATGGACASSPPPSPARQETSPETVQVPSAVDRTGCEKPAPPLHVSVSQPLSARDMAEIATIVGASPSAPIVRMEEARTDRKSPADRTIYVELPFLQT